MLANPSTHPHEGFPTHLASLRHLDRSLTLKEFGFLGLPLRFCMRSLRFLLTAFSPSTIKSKRHFAKYFLLLRRGLQTCFAFFLAPFGRFLVTPLIGLIACPATRLKLPWLFPPEYLKADFSSFRLPTCHDFSSFTIGFDTRFPLKGLLGLPYW